MSNAQVIQGTWEEIASHATELSGRDDLVLIVPAHHAVGAHVESPMNLAEQMKDYIGSIDLGDANLSENTGEKFTQLLVQAHRRDRR